MKKDRPIARVALTARAPLPPCMHENTPNPVMMQIMARSRPSGPPTLGSVPPPPMPSCIPPHTMPGSPLYLITTPTVNVAAGKNVSVKVDVDCHTGDKTYTVSSHTDKDAQRRINELEQAIHDQLAEIKRIKSNMLNVEEDVTEAGNGITFTKGMK